MAEPQNEQDAQTLFVRGITDEVDEEILFELFQNAGPLVKVNIPLDAQTKRKKTFCFVQFQHAESVPYAIELFKDLRLFGRNIQMQNRTTGAGIQKDQNHGPPQSNPNHQRTMSAPMPIGGQFNQPRHQQDMMPNQMLMQQQQNLMVQQRQQHQQNMQRQLSLDNPYQQNEYQNQLNYHQDQRRHHSHDRRNDYQQNYDRGGGHNREDRSRGGFDRQHSQGSNDFSRDRSHDRRSHDPRNNHNQHGGGGHQGRRRY